MKKLLLTTVISVLSLNAAYAYQAELEGGVGYIGVDVPGGTNEELSVNAAGTFYFKNVQADNGPLAEAAFIERASNVNAGYKFSNNDTFPDTRAHEFNLGGEFYVPNTNFYASAEVGSVKEESVDTDGGTYAARLGYLPITNLLLTVGATGTFDQGNDDVNPTVSAKYLTKIGNNDVNLEGDAVFTDNGDTYTVSGDYYVDRTLSLGASAATTTDQTDDNYEFGINARQFITNNISLKGELKVGHAFDTDGVGANLTGTYRF